MPLDVEEFAGLVIYHAKDCEAGLVDLTKLMEGSVLVIELLQHFTCYVMGFPAKSLRGDFLVLVCFWSMVNVVISHGIGSFGDCIPLITKLLIPVALGRARDLPGLPLLVPPLF